MNLLTNDVPRDVSIDKIIEYIEFIYNLGTEKTHKAKPGTEHNSRQVAIFFGFLDQRGRLTASGNALVGLPDKKTKLARMAIAFENTKCVQGWMEWRELDSIFRLGPNTAAQFLHKHSKLSKGRKMGGARVLKRFLKYLLPYHPLNPQLKISQPKIKKRKVDPISSFNRKEAGKILSELAKDTSYVRAASGFFTPLGYDRLARSLKQARMDLMVGSSHEEAIVALQNPMELYKQSIKEGAPSRYKRNSLRKLHLELLKGTSRVRKLRARHSQRLHAKTYIFDDVAAYVTSSNLTNNGLSTQVEAGHTVTREKNVKHLIERFDYYFEKAEPILTELIEPLEEGMMPPVKPGLVYLRALLELFRDAPDLSDTDYKLASFQNMVVANTLVKLETLKGVLMVSPTGTGKTIMGAYVAASLFPKEVRRIFVMPPNPSVGNDWKTAFRGFRVPLEVVTHGKLRLGEKTYIESLSESLNSKDLIIIDECHGFRNEKTKGIEILRNLIKLETANQPYLLLLTATPFGKGVENLNTLLKLTGSNNSIKNLDEVKYNQSMVHVTLPFIMKKFGKKKDENIGIEFPGRGWFFFADKKTRTATYDSSMEEIFSVINSLDLRKRKRWKSYHPNQTALLPDATEYAPGKEIAFLRILFAHCAESSPFALKSSIMKAKDTIKDKEFYDEETVKSNFDLILEKIPSYDAKLNELFKILDDYKNKEKILIFATFKETIRYLKENISNQYKKRRVEIITGDFSPGQREDILERFAPDAHDKTKAKRKNDIDILIATDCISEGQNLQDARLLINYDLYWTPLVLIQRVGRLDRPTPEKRTFNVFNFYPGDKIFGEISSLLVKVEERQKMYVDFASTQVVGDFDREFRKEELNERDLKFITEIYKGADYDEILESYIPTSQHLVDLASAKQSDKDTARKLPSGSRTAMFRKEHGIYVLLKYNRKKYSLWRADNKETIECAPIDLNHEVLLPKIKASMKKPLGTLPEDFDDLVGDLVKEWAESNDFTYDKVKIVFSEYLHGTEK